MIKEATNEVSDNSEFQWEGPGLTIYVIKQTTPHPLPTKLFKSVNLEFLLSDSAVFQREGILYVLCPMTNNGQCPKSNVQCQISYFIPLRTPSSQA